MASFGTARSNRSQGENITHFTGVRMRVTGVGELEMTLLSLDDVKAQQLLPFTMSSATNREPLRLSNFNEQRCYLHLGTDVIDEYFRINRIILFAKEIYTSYPGNE